MSAGLAEACKTPQAVAEEFRPSLIQSNVQNVLVPLARDVRGAIDYFEDLQGRQVSDGFLASDLFRSNLILDALQDLEIPCRRLDLNGALAIELPSDKEAGLQKDIAQLEVAVGAGAGWFRGQRIPINFLAEQIEAAAARRRDPLRWSAAIGAVLGVLVLLWAGSICWRSFKVGGKIRAAKSDLQSVEKAANEAMSASRTANQLDQSLSALEQHATNRFLWALPLNALQFATMDQIQVVNVKLEQNLGRVDAVAATPRAPAKAGQTREHMLLTITAKNFADTDTEEKFIERIASLPYFMNSLRKKDPVILKNRLPRQVDPLDPAKTFTLFTIECRYSERILGHD